MSSYTQSAAPWSEPTQDNPQLQYTEFDLFGDYEQPPFSVSGSQSDASTEDLDILIEITANVNKDDILPEPTPSPVGIHRQGSHDIGYDFTVTSPYEPYSCGTYGQPFHYTNGYQSTGSYTEPESPAFPRRYPAEDYFQFPVYECKGEPGTRPSQCASLAPSLARTKKQPAVNRPRRTNQRAKGHLWEFVRELLKSEEHNPKVVKWEDRERGIFRFVDSKEASRLWGEKKGNKNMNYANMSRALRYTKMMGYLKKVPKEYGLPSRLVFAFGEYATGWKADE